MTGTGLSATDTICGRRRELAQLETILASKRSEFLAVYGRRRVGKTFLIRQFFEPRAVFFEVTGRVNGTLEGHLGLFAESLSASFSPGVERVPPQSWHDAFRALREAIEQKRRSKKKVVLFFDELPWLATRRSDCLEELEHFWNSYASRAANIILVVCGSAAAWMLQKVVRARGGLHNRLTLSMRLLPFSLAETREYLTAQGHQPTLDEVAELYMTFGGVPHYLRLLHRGESVAQNIDRLCFDRAGELHHEFVHVFRSLFDDGDAHRRVVELLAQKRGGVPLKDLLEAIEVRSGGGAKRIISALEEAGFITIETPFGRKSRDRLARLSDELSLFALRWLKGGRARRWSQLRGSPSWRAWAGLAFEAICLKHVDAIEHALGISGVYTEASPWARAGDGGAQIDLLLDRADNVISVCELKFTEAPFSITKSYASELQRKVSVFREATGTKKAIRLVLVSARGVQRNKWSDALVDNVVTLEDLFR